MAFFVTLGLALLHGHHRAGTVVVVLAAILALGWAFMPLFFPSGDETLDPSRLVMLPLRPRPLVRALLVSSLVGVGPLFTLCLAVGSTIAVARGAATRSPPSWPPRCSCWSAWPSPGPWPPPTYGC